MRVGTILTVISWLLVCTSILTLASAFVPVSWLPLAQLLPATSVLQLLTAVVLLVFSWMLPTSRYPSLLAVFLVSLLLLFQFGTPAIETPKSRPDSDSIRLLSVNIQQFKNDTQHVREVVKLLDEYDADIVMFQEFGSYYKWPDITSVSKDFAEQSSYPHYDFTPMRGNIFGTACFSRYPIVQVDTVFQLLSATNEAKAYRIKLGSEFLHVANLHLMSYNLSNKEDSVIQRLKASVLNRHKQLSKVLQQPRDLIVGDFNSVPGDQIYRRISNDYRDVFRGFLLPTQRLVPVRIDHMFASESIDVLQTVVIDDFPGDHRALLIEFQLAD